MRANLLGKDLLATTLLDRLVANGSEGKDTVLSEFGIQNCALKTILSLSVDRVEGWEG